MRQRPLRSLPLLLVTTAVVAFVVACAGTGGQGGFTQVPASPAASSDSVAGAERLATPVSRAVGLGIGARHLDRNGLRAGLASAATATATGTAPTASPTASPSPSANPDPYAGVLFECFGITFPSDNLLGEVDTPAADFAGEFSRWLAEDADATFPRDGWRLLGEEDTGHLYGVLAPEGGEAAAFVVTIRNRNGAWQAEDFWGVHADGPPRRDPRRRDLGARPGGGGQDRRRRPRTSMPS